MAKYIKRDSKLEKDLMQVEDLMREKGISITSWGGNGLTVSFADQPGEFWIQSRSTGERSVEFPRMFDEEGLAVWE